MESDIYRSFFSTMTEDQAYAYKMTNGFPMAPGPRREGIVKIKRNAPCPCGSGRKYKRCCIDKEDKS